MEDIKGSELNVLEHLGSLRDNWSDEIPEQVIHSDSRIKSKVRRGWFQGVVAAVWIALDEGKISTPEAEAAAEQLMTRFTSKEFVNQELTKKEDIEEANGLIDVILGRKN